MQALGHIFKLPPFPLARLEAAVLPGPHQFDIPEPARVSEEPPREILLHKEESEGPAAVAEPTEKAAPEGELGKPPATAEVEQEAAAKPTSKPGGKKKGRRQATRKSISRQSKAGCTQLQHCSALHILLLILLKQVTSNVTWVFAWNLPAWPLSA